MKTFRKILVLFTFVLLIGSLAACSSINKVNRNFERAGYNLYEYNFRGGSLLFSDVDAIVDDLNITVDTTDGADVTTTTEEQSDVTTVEGEEPVTTATQNIIASVIGFKAYAFSDGDANVVIVLEFESEEKMAEVIDNSTTLQNLLEGLDPVDYTNGNCVLIADASIYDEMVEIFQGRYEAE
jgi:hypothetical protein